MKEAWWLSGTQGELLVAIAAAGMPEALAVSAS